MQETVEDGPFFCFQGADSEVNHAKIIQTEATFAKRKLNLLFTLFTPGKCQFMKNGAKSTFKNIKNGAKYNNNN